jgi:hypothetical protein
MIYGNTTTTITNPNEAIANFSKQQFYYKNNIEQVNFSATFHNKLSK